MPEGLHASIHVRQRRLGRRAALTTASAAGVGVAFAACGRSVAPMRRTQAPSPGAQDTPKPGGEVTVRVTTDPFDWDMTYAGRSAPNAWGAALALNTLIGFKSGPKVGYGDLMLEPQLAESWEIHDAQTYSFRLRRGVKFADIPPVSGRELTSADIKWTYEYASRSGQFKAKQLPPAQFNWFFEGLNSIETPDAYTVVLHFQEPFVPFINYAAAYFNPILAHDIYDQDGKLQNRIAGTGPYQLDQAASQKGSRWVWRRNPSYWDAGKPYPERVIWLVVPDDATAFAAFRTKQIDVVGAVADTIGTKSADQLRRDNPTAVLNEHFPLGPAQFVALNNRVAPLNDVRVRQAIMHAINPQEFIDSFSGGKGQWALPGAFPDTFTQEEVEQLVRFDPALSKQLLSQAGHANGVDLEFMYPGNAYGQEYILQIQLLQAQLKRAGINLTLKSLDKNAWTNNKATGSYVITAGSKAQSAVVDVDSYVYSHFHTGSSNNQFGVSDPKLDSLLEAQRRESDPAKRKELVRQAVRLVIDQAYSLAIFLSAEYQFWQPRLKGYNPNNGSIAAPQIGSWVEG